MSLNWSLKSVVDHRELFTDGSVQPITAALLWATVQVGLNKITADNVDEWLFRSMWMLRIGLANLTRGPTPSAFTRLEIERHIGLHTNADTVTRKQFMQQTLRHLERQVAEQIRASEWRFKKDHGLHADRLA